MLTLSFTFSTATKGLRPLQHACISIYLHWQMYIQTFVKQCRSILPTRAAESESESVVLTGVGVGVGVGKFSSTPTPARSQSRLQHFFIISFLVKMETKMETEHYVLTADGHDGLSCTVLLALGLRLFPGELAFKHTSRLDNHNRQRHSLWGQVTWPCLINFGGLTG